MKKLLFLFLATLLLSACMGEEVQTEITLDEINLSENETLTFSFTLTTAELSLPEDVRVSGTDDRDLDSGPLCRNDGTSLGCEVNLQRYQQPYLVKVIYENGDYSFTELTVPVPEFLDEPSLVSPTAAPEQNSDFELSFKDIGADEYKVEVYNCDEYQNDGISPCLDNSTYVITMESGVPEILIEVWMDDVEAYLPSVKIENGDITLKSSFKMIFAERVMYSIFAWKKTATGISSISESAEFEKL